MKFKELCECFENIERHSSRIEMTQILSELFSELKVDESSIVCYLINSRVCPLFISKEFNISTKSLIKAMMAVASEIDGQFDVAKEYDNSGDLGLVVQSLKSLHVSSRKYEEYSLEKIYDKLWEIVNISGTGSSTQKMNKIIALLRDISPVESKFLVRVLSDRMRLGLSGKTVLDALSVCKTGTKDDRDDLELAYGVCSDLGYLANVYLDGGLESVKKIGIIPGNPIMSMLVEREKDFESIWERIDNPIVQPKFDGIRCQIHIVDDFQNKIRDRVWSKYLNKNIDTQQSFLSSGNRNVEVKIYSRNLEDMTDMFPEVVSSVKSLNLRSAVFDSEVIAYDESTGTFLPFQDTMVRKRKYDIANVAMDVPVKAFIFDLLYLNGESLIVKPTEERIKMLADMLEDSIKSSNNLVLAKNWNVKSVKELESVFYENVNAGLEGIIVKNPVSFYRPGRRSYDWIKMKKSIEGRLVDTIDVVIMGFYFGRGSQVDFGIGALLGGVYDEKLDRYVSITKIGTGITDEQWVEIKKTLDKFVVKTQPDNYDVARTLLPDVWVIPKVVATVEADEITRSPVHKAGLDSSGIGYALRFPRLVVWDRQKESCTTVAEVKSLYKKQKGN
ncbi:ATP-dependent DNA ligase [Candidatus Dojkabacteria bacterium]|nr:ATP-dependent DNA ligase [Candidatus Dojkabacteria bacterium]